MKRAVTILAVLMLSLGTLAKPLPVVRAQSLLRGFAYGPFRDGQSPNQGIFPTAAQIRADLQLLRVDGKALRSYGCVNLEAIAAESDTAGFTVAQGVWLNNVAADQDEINCAVAQVKAHPSIALLIAGNERLLNKQMTADQVCAAIATLKQRTRLPVGTAEPWHIWQAQPKLVACADVLFVHIHPYWECQPIAQAATYVATRYAELKQQYPSKRIIIAETGWPSAGPPPSGCTASVPSEANQARFAHEFLQWAKSQAVEYFFFEAFDEAWKCATPEGVECHWGAYTAQRTPKATALAFHLSTWVPTARTGP